VELTRVSVGCWEALEELALIVAVVLWEWLNHISVFALVCRLMYKVSIIIFTVSVMNMNDCYLVVANTAFLYKSNSLRTH